MIWLTWRQHRTEGLIALGVLAMLGALLPYQHGRFLEVAVPLLLLPILLGALVGAPLVAREYEQRTYLLVWMQSITHTRWLTVQLALVLGAGVVAAGALMILLNRWFISFSQGIGRFNPVAFDFSGPVLIAATVMGLALGVAAGALTRRTVLAISLTLALIIAIRLPVELVLRPNYEPPITVTWPLEADAPTSVTVNFQGWVTDSGYLDPQGHQIPNVPCHVQDYAQCVKDASDLGYSNYLTYQPANRFWHFQWIETSIYLAISALAVAVTAWLIRRRLG